MISTEYVITSTPKKNCNQTNINWGLCVQLRFCWLLFIGLTSGSTLITHCADSEL
jgi:hypothetical protein